MKKLFIILTCILSVMLFSQNSYAKSIKEYFNLGKDKADDVVESVKREKCPITNDTPIKLIDRPTNEITLRSNFGDFPSGGKPQFRFENFDIEWLINLGPTFHWYAWMGSRTTEKIKYTNSVYDEVWTSNMIFSGFGIYFIPSVRLFVGLGSITLSNDEGDEPTLDTGLEIGGAWSKEVYGNRFEIMFKTVTSEISGDSVPSEKASGSGSYNSLSIGFSFPLGD